jgi:hypothetical protein
MILLEIKSTTGIHKLYKSYVHFVSKIITSYISILLHIAMD